MPTTVIYTEGLVRRAVFRWWLRFINWHGFASIAIVGLLFVYTLVSGREPWMVYGSLVLFIALAGTAVSVYVACVRRSLARLRRMGEYTMDVTISAESFHGKSSLADSTVQWRAIQAVWRFPEAWLLFLGKNLYMTLPIENISAADRELMCAMIKQYGGKVR